ncbi:hypothetical protein E2C01_052249 [Portunus trituberculatus]|uniref:Uncharacterized protein n=1 Tax=Portunus trituberculatus TaxID=210409 RepID=A0A5B7GLC8_PORTR|nr:hypothetical protein [Portunus trituberculatus]
MKGVGQVTSFLGSRAPACLRSCLEKVNRSFPASLLLMFLCFFSSFTWKLNSAVHVITFMTE